MIHTAITAIRYQSISIDLLQQAASTINPLPLSSDSHQEMHHPLRDIDAAVTSGTWYEEDLDKGGLVIDETYYQKDIASVITPSDSSSTLSIEQQPPPTRRSFKTPPTTVVMSTTSNRPKPNSSYLLLSEKFKQQLPGKETPILSSPSNAPVITNNSSFRKSVVMELEKMNSMDSIEVTTEEQREAFSYEFPTKRIVSASGLDRCDLSLLVEIYSRPLICNHHLMRSGTQRIMNLFQKWLDQEEMIRQKKSPSSSLGARAGGGGGRTSLENIFCDLSFDCLLEISHDTLVENLMIEESLPEVCVHLHEILERSNQEMCKRWSLVLSSLPKVMKEITQQLRIKYIHGMRAFWKGQSILFRCRSLHLLPLFTLLIILPLSSSPSLLFYLCSGNR
jgi:hypothetical protein